MADFSGYATRNDVRCADGRTIMRDAFKNNDGAKVPLVWQHGHDNPNNVLGHVILENRTDGVYAQGFFNDTDAAAHIRSAVEHGDLDSLSIYANQLVESGGNVMHGNIREVSLVLAGANPEARIDNVVIKHSEDWQEVKEDKAFFRFGAALQHDEDDSAEGKTVDPEHNDDDDRTVEDVINTFNDEQLAAFNYVIESVANAGDEDDEDSENDQSKDEQKEPAAAHSAMNQGDSNMKRRNIFESNTSTGALSHADKAQAVKTLNSVIADAAKHGTLQEALQHNQDTLSNALSHAIGTDTDYGINSLELLFPDAQGANKPEAIRRNQEWVNSVLSGVSKRPFSRIKMMNFDMTHEEARARGYIRGSMKKEMYFSMVKRETAPTTIYQKQKIDRDDIVDITTVDIVSWMWAEMRISLNEEIARAILFGDGRNVDDPDKIREDKIRPIVKDDQFYSHQVGLPNAVLEDGYQLIDTMTEVMQAYKGSGTPTLYTSLKQATKFKLLRDNDKKRLFRTNQDIADEIGVKNIVIVDDGILHGTDIVGVIVNLSDYAVGTDKGGEITSFEDFDIDYNQYKYLLEGRMSGSLTKPKSAIVLRTTSGSEVTESSALINPAPTHEPTVPVGATYRSTGPNGGKVREAEVTEGEEA